MARCQYQEANESSLTSSSRRNNFTDKKDISREVHRVLTYFFVARNKFTDKQDPRAWAAESSSGSTHPPILFLRSSLSIALAAWQVFGLAGCIAGIRSGKDPPS
eukprot:m.263443 g.263443  ORF g.263443 m.263443 type:complete len:104 (+) comp26757_c0_seq1:1130-1441(+)